MPNARVRVGPALVGGIIGGIAWQSAGWVFAVFIAGSGNYAAIYASFAILILFMIWLYLSWLVLLFGASVAFYVQHPEYLYMRGGEPRLSNRMRERLGMSVMALVVRRFLAGETPPSQLDLTRTLKVPTHVLAVVLDALQARALMVATADDMPAYLPARDPARITVAEVLDTVRAAGEDGFLTPSRLPSVGAVDDVIAQMQQATVSALDNMSLRDLAERPRAAAIKATTTPAPGQIAEPIWIETQRRPDGGPAAQRD
ncbi:MAG: YhjD/YihY/BrkB family envelope integrity protein, partial [Betaproteobacteria bacterium]